MGFGFVWDVLILSIVFVLSIIFRKRIADLILKIKLPRFLLFLLASIPFILIEENINCLPTGCKLIPWTVPVLLVFVAVLGFFVRKFNAKTVIIPTIIFAVLGTLFEFFLGVSSGGFFVNGTAFGIFMVCWVALSYAFLVVVPLTIFIEKSN